MALIWAGLTQVVIVGILFPLTIKFPFTAYGPNNTFFLAGAGKRGEIIGGEYVTHSIDGVYLEESAMKTLSEKWGGTSSEELDDTVGFYRDIYNGDFQKIIRVTFLNHVNGQNYSDTVAKKCIALWKANGKYNKKSAEEIKKFMEFFETKNFPPKSSIFYIQSPSKEGLRILLSKDGTLSSNFGNMVLRRSKPLSNTILELLIGKNGLSPATKKSLAVRLSKLMD